MRTRVEKCACDEMQDADRSSLIRSTMKFSVLVV